MSHQQEVDLTMQIADEISAIGKKYDLPVLIMAFIQKDGMHYARAHGDRKATAYMANVIYNQETLSS